jgi:hypothetical protein
MWDPRRLTNLWASTACYRDSFTFALHKFIYQKTELMITTAMRTSTPINHKHPLIICNSKHRVKLATSPLSVSRLSGKCWSLDFSQPYEPPRSITEIALLFFFSSKHSWYLLLHLFAVLSCSLTLMLEAVRDSETSLKLIPYYVLSHPGTQYSSTLRQSSVSFLTLFND